MICSDLDGTLLTYTQTKMSERLFSIIRKLNEKDILFVPTSGRQIVSMRRLFEPVTEYCYYICSGGAVIFDGHGEIVDKIPMPREDAMGIAHDFWNLTDERGEVNVAGATCCNLMSRDLGMLERINFIGNKYKIIDKPEDVTEDIVKVSVYLPDGSERYIDRFAEKWKKYNPAIAGPYWIDTAIATKGDAIKRLCKRFGISVNDVAAFGDNYNDISMLDTVGHPYIMSSATDELLKRYPNHTACVEDTLEDILSSL